jgi:hypothetical protein
MHLTFFSARYTYSWFFGLPRATGKDHGRLYFCWCCNISTDLARSIREKIGEKNRWNYVLSVNRRPENDVQTAFHRFFGVSPNKPSDAICHLNPLGSRRGVWSGDWVVVRSARQTIEKRARQTTEKRDKLEKRLRRAILMRNIFLSIFKCIFQMDEALFVWRGVWNGERVVGFYSVVEPSSLQKIRHMCSHDATNNYEARDKQLRSARQIMEWRKGCWVLRSAPQTNWEARDKELRRGESFVGFWEARDKIIEICATNTWEARERFNEKRSKD